MTLFTPRQHAASLAALLFGGFAVVAVVAGWSGGALVALTVLVVAGCLLLLDLRRRHQVAGRAQARLATQVDALTEELRSGLATLAQEGRGHRHAVESVAHQLEESTRLLNEEAALLKGEAALLKKEAADHAEVTHTLLKALDHEPVAEVQALLQLIPKVPGAPPLPAVGGWALTAASLLQIWHLVETRRPRSIVECGSGTSTLWLAYAARRVEGARVVALEHDAGYADATRALLEEHGLSDIADVRHAPLREVTFGEKRVSWYDTAQLKDIDTIDLLLVDGPPKWTSRLARFPAVPLLRDRLAPDAVVLADDATRPGEKKAIRRWQAEYDLGPPEKLSRDLVLMRCH